MLSSITNKIPHIIERRRRLGVALWRLDLLRYSIVEIVYRRAVCLWKLGKRLRLVNAHMTVEFGPARNYSFRLTGN